MKKKKQLSLEDPEAYAAFMEADILPKSNPSSKRKSDPNAGKKIKCGLCGTPIRKGREYWMSGPWILCKTCHDFCHGKSDYE